MLELRPTCENCNCALPPASTEAMICTFECTFCRSCVEEVLRNVCPNCGGGFCPRPIRPAHDRNGGNFVGRHPPSDIVKHKPVNAESQRRLVEQLAAIPPHLR